MILQILLIMLKSIITIITPYPSNKFDDSTTKNEVNELLKKNNIKK